MNIGFIGIGNMGVYMAQHILDAGYQLCVNDLDKSKAHGLLEKGAGWVDTPKAMAESCELVLSSLPGPPEVEKVVYGDNGLMAGWKKGDIYVDLSTNSPSTVRKIAEDAKGKGVDVLDAPVSGGVPGAREARLTVIVGGSKDSLDKIRDILNTFGTRLFHVGEIGCGNVAKLVNNMIALTCNAVNAEGFVLGVKAGIDPVTLLEVLKVSTGNNHSLMGFTDGIFKGKFEPNFRMSLAYKDISLALALGKDYGAELPIGTIVAHRMGEAIDGGLGDKGVQAIILQLEKAAGVQVRHSD
jgi:3-hydroxyisobutyrate dehydrogenase-like beta-hydroxyacid dehydrogenase